MAKFKMKPELVEIIKLCAKLGWVTSFHPDDDEVVRFMIIGQQEKVSEIISDMGFDEVLVPPSHFDNPKLN